MTPWVIHAFIYSSPNLLQPFKGGNLQLLARLVCKVVDGACFGREADAYLVYFALVGGVWLDIALLVYLFQGNFRRGVELELEDIDIVGTLQHAVDATLARLFLNVGVVFAEQLEDEVEGVLEMTLTLPRVLLALEAVGDVGKETRQLEPELLEVATAQGTGNIDEP